MSVCRCGHEEKRHNPDELGLPMCIDCGLHKLHAYEPAECQTCGGSGKLVGFRKNGTLAYVFCPSCGSGVKEKADER